jgi:hypothetical protein
LLVVAGLNYFALHFNNKIIYELVLFLNQNLAVLVVISILFMVGEVLSVMSFPSNIPYPLFEAMASFLTVRFAFSSAYVLRGVLGEDMVIMLQNLEPFLAYMVMIVVLAIGLIRVVWSRHGEEKKAGKEEKKKEDEKRQTTWQEVGNEFRNLFFDIASGLRRLFGGKGKKK